MLISEVENSQQLPGHTLGYVHTVELEIFFHINMDKCLYIAL